MAGDIEKFKTILAVPFPSGRALLNEALTHRSYAMENQLKYDNQRLEFLGDAVLEIILTEYLYRKYPAAAEGEMTKMRSALAQQEALANLARLFNMGEYLKIGHGECAVGGADRESTLSDLFEAVVGAIYLENGLEITAGFVITAVETIYPEAQRLLTNLNPKGTLQEYAQRKWGAPPVYQVVATDGPDHLKNFTCEVTVDKLSTRGTACGRRQAEFKAAQNAIDEIAKIDPTINEFI